MKTKKELFLSRVDKNGTWVEGMDTQCWNFIPKNKNYITAKVRNRLSFNLGNGVTKTISLCAFLYFTGKLPDGNIYSLCKNHLCVNPSHFIQDKGVATYNEFFVGKIRHKFCPSCKKSFPKTREFFIINNQSGAYCLCKPCEVKKIQKDQAHHWERTILYYANTRKKKSGMVCTLTIEDIKGIFKKQNGKCYWTGLEMRPSTKGKSPFQPSLDRLNNDRGYTPDNVVLSCLAINFCRNSSTQEEFKEFLLELKDKGIQNEQWK